MEALKAAKKVLTGKDGNAEVALRDLVTAYEKLQDEYNTCKQLYLHYKETLRDIQDNLEDIEEERNRYRRRLEDQDML